MGVKGLWTVLQPCARPTNLATLNRKRLAVDASIWIYQFLKAVRDKEGNALRNSHVVGFFRRICKLLWFGILPVFVFDGGAPALKRATLQGRRRRREGRREDAVRTAGKLLAVQMQRAAEEEGDRRRRAAEEGAGAAGAAGPEAPPEEIPDVDDIIYADEVGMSRQERQQTRKFYKRDAYHLPELEGGIEAMGKPEDPRIMSVEELEQYARQFHSGEDINLYDFSNIDFDGDFFKSLPPADRYNILNAARIRSRLRMGLSKDQLDDMFPDRMAFSRFQIERVRERNHLTQRLMYELGMAGTDLTVNGGRIAGDKNREYILVKNDDVEGGWALGVVSRDKDSGQMHKPIDVDQLEFRYQAKGEEEEEEAWEDDEEFEDVPVEGLNRLPNPARAPAGAAPPGAAYDRAREASSARQRLYGLRAEDSGAGAGEESLFVNDDADDGLFGDGEVPAADEDEDINRAIAMSLQNQHSSGLQEGAWEGPEEAPAPGWTQKAVGAPTPITATAGQMVARIVNDRATAAVRRRESDASSDSEMDLQAALATARRKQPAAPRPEERAPLQPSVKNPFDGPLPFQALDWKRSIFADPGKPTDSNRQARDEDEAVHEAETHEGGLPGGFERGPADEKTIEPRPLPPWLLDDTDIRESIRGRQEVDRRMNAEDEEAAREEELLLQRRKEGEVVLIESSSDEDSDVEIVDVPPPGETSAAPPALRSTPAGGAPPASSPAPVQASALPAEAAAEEPGQAAVDTEKPAEVRPESRSPSPEIEFEDVELPTRLVPPVSDPASGTGGHSPDGPYLGPSEDVAPLTAHQDWIGEQPGPTGAAGDDLFPDAPGVEEFDDDLSDAEEEELLAQMAQEAEEHARFASQLNHRSEKENQEAYERELRALRNQQKKDRRDADEVTQTMVAECQSLLRLFGIPYITAPMEAEAQCAELVRLGLVDGVVTDDSDIFLFGGTRVYKNMFNGNKLVECYLSSDMEKELSLSRAELISLAQLLGSDYTEGLPGIGPVTAVEILSEFPGPDGLDEFKRWWQDVQLHGRAGDADAAHPFRRKLRRAHGTKLFLPPGFPSPAVAAAYAQPEVDASAEPFRWGVPDLDGLRRFLTATIGWGQERTDEVLVPVIRDMNRRDAEGTQSNITRFFHGAVGAGARGDASAPRQRPRGSRRMADAVGRLRAKNTTSSAAAAGPLAADLPVMAMPGPRPKRKAGKTPAAGDGAGSGGEGGGRAAEGGRDAGGAGEGDGTVGSARGGSRRGGRKRPKAST